MRAGIPFQVAPELILFGTQPPAWVSEPAPAIAPTLSLPLFAAGAGESLRRWLTGGPNEGPTYVITDDTKGLSPGSFAVRVESQEMRAKPPAAGERELLPGDIVLIDRRQPLRPGDIAVLLVADSEAIHLRKAVARGSAQLAFVALNRDYGEIDGQVVGRVALHVQHL